MARHKDADWVLPEGKPIADGRLEHSWESIKAALLMDIRDELQSLNRILHCAHFLSIPHKLDEIRRNTRKKKAKRRP